MSARVRMPLSASSHAFLSFSDTSMVVYVLPRQHRSQVPGKLEVVLAVVVRSRYSGRYCYCFCCCRRRRRHRMEDFPVGPSRVRVLARFVGSRIGKFEKGREENRFSLLFRQKEGKMWECSDR